MTYLPKPETKVYIVQHREMTEAIVVKSSRTWTKVIWAWSCGKGRVKTADLRLRDWDITNSRGEAA